MASVVPSSLWRISDFERRRESLGMPTTVLPTTLVAELRQLQSREETNDVLEVVAACLRHREAALMYLAHGTQVWPVTLFPTQALYHSPRPLATMQQPERLAGLRLLAVERPLLRPPGHPMHERVADESQYHPTAPLMWALAMHGPRAALLAEIGGRAAYRLAAGQGRGLAPTGALGPAMARLRLQAAPLDEIARWPGMGIERAGRLLNALYLSDALMVTRAHPAARDPAARGGWRRLFGRQ